MATRLRPKARNLYDDDFHVWTEVQAKLLRRLPVPTAPIRLSATGGRKPDDLICPFDLPSALVA
jgi:hypothetical protein